MYKIIMFSLFLLIGCVGSQVKPETVELVQTKQVEQVRLEQVIPEPQLVSDKKIFTGKVWEFRVPYGWDAVYAKNNELYLVNGNGATKASLMKQKYSDNLKNFTQYSMKMIKSSGASLTTTKHMFVNTRDSIELEHLLEDNVAWSWLFTTGTEAYTFSCGGNVVSFETHYELCMDLLKGLYVGKAP